MTDPEISDSGREKSTFLSQSETSSEEWSDLLFQILFELEKKYAKHLKRKEIVKVEESETDRERVSNAYLYLKNLKENLIDSELYQDFIDMSELREQSFLDQLLHPEQRLGEFASKIAKLCQSIISFEGNSNINQEKVTIYLSDNTLTFDSLEEIKDFIRLNKDFLISFNTIPITRVDEMNLEQYLLEKLKNQKIKLNELNAILSCYEAELLSKLISEKKIIAIQEGNYLIFKEVSEEKQSISSSYLLSPSKK